MSRRRRRRVAATHTAGAIIAGDLADFFGRRTTIIAGCLIFIVGVILQTASAGWKLLVAGRLVAGFGVGFESAIVILYLSEIAPRKVRGALVSGYQFCITIGILIASCVNYATQNRMDTGSYRIPIAIQFLWAIILGGGLFFLPESPRFFVKRGQLERAANSLSRIRGQPEDSTYIKDELKEIVANAEYEASLVPTDSYWSSWKACFSGGLRRPNSNLRLTILGTALQMMQQLTGINFIFYFVSHRSRCVADSPGHRLLPVPRHHLQPLPHRPHHNPRQRVLDPHLLLAH